MSALSEETKSAYRIQMHRFADLAFAEIKERLYRQKISWKEISSSANNQAVLINDIITISFEPLGTRNFHRKVMLRSVGKKSQNGDEWHLVTVKVEFMPADKKNRLFRREKKSKDSCFFTYQVLVSKPNPAAQSQIEKEPPKPIKETTPTHSKN